MVKVRLSVATLVKIVKKCILPLYYTTLYHVFNQKMVVFLLNKHKPYAREVTIIGASLSEPHTNCYYEKIAIVMYVCVCVRDTSSTCCTRARTRECTYTRVYVRTCG